jgi:hypothetical protein
MEPPTDRYPDSAGGNTPGAQIGSFATIAVPLAVLGIMLGIVKPADALRRVGTILGVVMLLMLIPAILMRVWSGMSL